MSDMHPAYGGNANVPATKSGSVQTFNLTVPDKSKTQYVFYIFMVLLLAALAGIIFDNPHQNWYAVLAVLDVVWMFTAIYGYKSYFAEQKIIEIHPDRLVIKGSKPETILFSDISFFRSFFYRSQSVTITLKNGRNINYMANQAFDQDHAMDKFIEAFLVVLERLRASGQFGIKQKKSLFETKGYLAVCIIITAGMVFLPMAIWYKGQPFPFKLLYYYLYAGIMWAAYFVTRAQNSGKD